MRASRRILVVIAVAIVIAALLYMYRPKPSGGKCVLELPSELSWLTKKPRTINVSIYTPEGIVLQNCSRAPTVYTCDGIGRPPIVSWTPVPHASSYVLIVYDPDAPLGVFYHLIAYNIVGSRFEGVAPSLPNSGGGMGWYPICPPRGHGVHRYIFLVVALEKTVKVKSFGELLSAMYRYGVAWGATLLTYSR